MLLDDGAAWRLVTTAPVIAIALAAVWLLIGKLVLVPSDYSDVEVAFMTIEDHLELLPQPLPESRVEVRAPRPTPQVARIPAEPKPPEPVIEISLPKPRPRARVALVEPSPPRARPVIALSSPLPSLDEPRVHPSRPAHRTRPEFVAQIRQQPALTLPVPAAPASDFSPVQFPGRMARSQAPVTERERLRPTLAAVPTALPESANQQPAVRRPGHHSPGTGPERRSFEVAALASPGMAAAPVSGPVESSSQRSSRVQYEATSSAATGSGESLQSVPLGSLADCLSDRLEDSLKQRLIAVVRMREECRNSAGTYRFVETKNLNAFLMWIERAPGRVEADRCEELRLALLCLREGMA